MWSILAALYEIKENPHRVSKYTQYENELKFEGIEFPVKLGDIPKFERQNEIKINVFDFKIRESKGNKNIEFGVLYNSRTN